MPKFRYRSRAVLTGFFVLAITGGIGLVTAARADILSDNLSSTSGGVETTTGNRWLATSFGTGAASAYTLDSVTLLLANTSTGIAGSARLDLYSQSLLAPGSLIGSLVSPASYSTSLANTTFTAASGLSLSANTTYWVVLKGTSGSFDWSWTSANTGTGAGYQNTWGETDDAGASWYTYDLFPTQIRVNATPVGASAVVPEPGTLALLLAGGASSEAGLMLRRRKSRYAR